MEPPGGLAEVRLYRRPAPGAALVELASLELVAPPRLLEVSTDPRVVVDGDLGRSAGLYLALVQDGRVVDVARLLAYSGEAATAEDQEEDYWKNGSDTEEERAESEDDPRRATDVFQYRSTSSSSQGDGGRDKKHGDASDEDDDGEEDDDNDGEAGEHQSGPLRMGWDLYHWNSSSADVGSDRDDGVVSESEDDDDEMEDDDNDEMEEADAKDSEEAGDEDAEETDDEEADDEDDEETDDEEADDDDDEEETDDEEADDEDDEETDDEEADDDDEEAGDEDDEEADDEGRVNVRLWPAKKHIRLKLFSGEKWTATKVYRLSWINYQELEDLFQSSFKMDICAPIPANTIFRIQDCVMDFEVSMFQSPLFDDLVAEVKGSVGDLKFCQKVGGEGKCRVFKCLSHGRKFALKTIRLDGFCSSEPREVDIISSLKDKRVMDFYQAWIEPWTYKNRPSEDYIFIQLELCKSTLKHKLLPENKKSIPDRWQLFEEMVKGLKEIHDEFIVHRDLKPDNIFFRSDMQVLIGDFGDACIGRDEFGGYGGTPSLGTEFYSAPELAVAEKISEKADIYPMGVMLIEIVTTLDTEFERRKTLGGLRKVGLPDTWVADLVGDRDGTRKLVEAMIASEPADRPSAVDILERIQHCLTSEGVGDGVDELQAGE